MPYRELASYKRFDTHLKTNWPTFSAKRSERLRQQGRFGEASERVAENIVEDLFTVALDWKLGDINNQVDYADIVITRLGIKYCIVETKRPGALAWNRAAVHGALEQARRYADEQKVKCIAVSDGVMFYAANIEGGGLRDRVFVSLESREPHNDLWWLSEHGVYRPRIGPQDEPLTLLEPAQVTQVASSGADSNALLHPKYCLPAQCFAYIGDANRPATWKLPYLREDGSIDVKRLPKAIQSILSNYRGAKVSSVPEKAIPDVLRRLAAAAEQLGKMPYQGETAEVYEMLAQALKQVDSA
ncbi:MAG: hypothetical protein ABSC87_03810 [Halobacteriota archaeon]|jgi:hypothetical protein